LPHNQEWIVPTIVQHELARWLWREMSDAAASRLLAFTMELIVVPLPSLASLLSTGPGLFAPSS
jgi:hypothetical protein